MTTLQIYALVWLAFVFGLSLWQHINLGLIMIPASFLLALFTGRRRRRARPVRIFAE